MPLAIRCKIRKGVDPHQTEPNKGLSNIEHAGQQSAQKIARKGSLENAFIFAFSSSVVGYLPTRLKA